MSVLHPAPAATPWRLPQTWRLPGTVPVAPEAWLQIDSTYGAQLAARRHLIATRRSDVIALEPATRPAADELLQAVLTHLRARPDFQVSGHVVQSPAGPIPLDPQDPLATLGRLVPEDFCLLTKAPNATEHRLTGAVLCFPSGWTLCEKLGRPLAAIHLPVDSYDADIARRVQRLCDAVTWERPLTRGNAHAYDHADLYDPRREADPRRAQSPDARYLRVERQVLRRLPRTRAVVFSIHTSITRIADLPAADRLALR